MALVQRVCCWVPLKSGVKSHLNLSGVGATGPKTVKPGKWLLNWLSMWVIWFIKSAVLVSEWHMECSNQLTHHSLESSDYFFLQNSCASWFDTIGCLTGRASGLLATCFISSKDLLLGNSAKPAVTTENLTVTQNRWRVAIVVVTFRMRCSRGKVYSGHGHLCVCLSITAFSHYCMDPDVSCTGFIALTT